MAAARIALDLQPRLYLGNLDAKRDWGHAKDYVRGMWLMLQQNAPQDFVLATGKMITVREFCRLAFKAAGIDVVFEGTGADEKGRNTATGQVIVEVDPRYYRPAEVEQLLGDPSKAIKELGWEPSYTLEQMVAEMVESDLRTAEATR